MKFIELTFSGVLPQKNFLCDFIQNQSKKTSACLLNALVIKDFLANFTISRGWAKKPLSKPIVRFFPFREWGYISLAVVFVPLDLKPPEPLNGPRNPSQSKPDQEKY